MATNAVEQNRSYFNAEASSYESKHGKTIEQLIEHIQDRLDFIGADWVDDDDDDDDDQGNASGSQTKSVRVLDYACGTGLISRALAPYTTQCVGVDISENMVAAYNARAENQGLSKDEMFAMPGNLLVPENPHPAELSEANLFNFDVAAVGLGFHHFTDPDLAAKRLVERLRPGGVLFIVDFLPHEHRHDHGASHTVLHHGFSKERVREIFEKAGAGKGFAIQELGVGIVVGGHGHGDGDGEDRERRKRKVFLARGEKGA